MTEILPYADYNVSSEEASLLKRVIGGIQDDEELKQHLLQIRSEAYCVVCFQTLSYGIVVLLYF